MTKLIHSGFFLFAIFLFLWPEHVLGQEPLIPPLSPPAILPPDPPDPDTLPPPPQLQWESLTPKGGDDISGGSVEAVIPPEQLETPIAPPPPPVTEIPLPAPDPAELVLAQPSVEVWRAGSESPQVPPRQFNKLDVAYVTGTEPVWLRVQFDPAAAGKTVYVKPSRGITLNPPMSQMTISGTGECLFLAQVPEDFTRSHIIFYCEGIKTVLPVVRASLEKVEEMEGASLP
ncbi:MAG TPA: hypothetical protein VJU77_11445 [Chthoniobacterales bacterium]|nr:hypothetical protein [Chthoniobacterales bacterium]